MIQKEFVSHWHQYIENMTQTPKEFYTSVEDLIKEEQLPDVKTNRVKHSEKGLFSANREYLQIKSKGYFFDVCAAPYGRGFFVSYWQRENRSAKGALLERIPIFGRLFRAVAMPETFFTIDTRLMFQGAVHSCIVHAINSMLEAKGMKALSEVQKAAPAASN
jgi:hypothetical protein